MGRGLRLREWLDKMADDGLDLQLITGLILDLLTIVADFSVSLEHGWPALTAELQKRPCECMSSPSKRFATCDCWIWYAQHVCSLYTIGHSMASEFSLTIHNRDKNWWAGVMWTGATDGFQKIYETDSPKPFAGYDSMAAMQQTSALLCSYRKDIGKFERGICHWDRSDCWTFGNDGRTVKICESTVDKPIKIVIRVKRGVANSSVIEFNWEGHQALLTSSKSYLEARPFVQLQSRGHSSFEVGDNWAVIETPLFPMIDF